jgi:glucose 1-dehydrogenase
LHGLALPVYDDKILPSTIIIPGGIADQERQIMDLKGKTALITGGGIRLGRAIALALAKEGCNVAIHYNRSAEDASEVRQLAQDFKVKAEIFQYDLSDFENIDQLMKKVNEKLGPVDILINNAGNYKRGNGLKTDLDILHTSFNVNLFAPWWLIKAFVKQLPAEKNGKIVNVCDANIYRTATDHFAYRLTKKGLCELTRMFALELAPNITVNAVAPGIMLPLAGYEHLDMEQVAEARKIPLGHIGSPEIIAENVLHLLNQDFMTGTILRVDGGEHIV